jgi:hypothetical protein
MPLWLLLTTLSGAAGAEPTLRGFAGEWERVGSEPTQERLSAIETAITPLSWVMRGIAGPVLRNSTQPSARYVFEVDDDGVRMSSRGEAPSPLTLDGQTRIARSDRGVFEVRSERQGDGIRTHWKAEEAYGSNTFELQGLGEEMIVSTTLVVTAISGVKPIVYAERFRRAPPQPSPAAGAPPGKE